MDLILIVIMAAMAAMVYWVFKPVSGGGVERGDPRKAVHESGEPESETITEPRPFSAEAIGRALARHRKLLLAAIVLLAIFGVYRSNGDADERARRAEQRAWQAERRLADAEKSVGDADCDCTEVAESDCAD